MTMNAWPSETWRTVASLIMLVALLAWESFAPFFSQFTRASGERVRHGLRNLALGGLNAALNGLICVSLWWAVGHWARVHGFGLLNWLTLPVWAHIPIAFVLLDLWMYAWHRMNHRMAFLWRDSFF